MHNFRAQQSWKKTGTAAELERGPIVPELPDLRCELDYQFHAHQTRMSCCYVW